MLLKAEKVVAKVLAKEAMALVATVKVLEMAKMKTKKKHLVHQEATDQLALATNGFRLVMTKTAMSSPELFVKRSRASLTT